MLSLLDWIGSLLIPNKESWMLGASGVISLFTISVILAYIELRKNGRVSGLARIRISGAWLLVFCYWVLVFHSYYGLNHVRLVDIIFVGLLPTLIFSFMDTTIIALMDLRERGVVVNATKQLLQIRVLFATGVFLFLLFMYN